MTQRSKIIFGVGAAVVLLLTGCVQVPKPVSAIPPPRPAFDANKAQALQDNYTKVINKAGLDTDLAATVETGDQLARTRASNAYLERFGYGAWDDLKLTKTAAFVPAAGPYPRAMLMISRTSWADDSWRTVNVYERGDASAPWKVALASTAEAKRIPTIAKDKNGLVTEISDDATGYVVAPASVPAHLARALGDPKSKEAKTFENSWLKGTYAEQAKEVKRTQGWADVRYDYTGRNYTWAVVADDDSYLIVGTYDEQITWTALPGHGIVKKADSAAKKVYPDSYRTTADNYIQTFVAEVPKKGLIKVLGTFTFQTGITASG